MTEFIYMCRFVIVNNCLAFIKNIYIYEKKNQEAAVEREDEKIEKSHQVTLTSIEFLLFYPSKVVRHGCSKRMKSDKFVCLVENSIFRYVFQSRTVCFAKIKES